MTAQPEAGPHPAPTDPPCLPSDGAAETPRPPVARTAPPHADAPRAGPEPRSAGGASGGSCVSIHLLSGSTALSAWGGDTAAEDPAAGAQLYLDPGRLVVVGRAEGYVPEYLDPAYRPTRIVPGTGQAVVASDHGREDNWVSRGHFTLRAAGGGVVLTNGVPRVGGGVRPPVNGTWVWEGAGWRPMTPGEEYPIAPGAAADFYLPNATVVRIAAA